MNKSQLTRETVLQYLYDYGEIKACKLLKITSIDIDKILNPSKEDIYIHKNDYKNIQLKAEVAEVIANNYEHLRAKYVGNTTYLELSQTDEDIFHNTLLKVISEGIEDNVLDQIEYRIKMLRYQTKMDNKQLKKLFTNAIPTETSKAED